MTVEERIRACLAREMPEHRLVRTWPLTGGISASMTAFLVSGPAGEQRLIARQPNDIVYGLVPHAAAHEYAVLRALTSAGLKVPPPVFCEPSSPDVPYPFFVVEYIEGQADFTPADLEGYLRKYAKQLAQIHLTSFDGLDLPVQKRDYVPAGDVLNFDLREGEIRAALNSYGGPRVRTAVLRHGDYWPGNVLWNQGEIAGVIDWEGVRIGEAMSDLAIARLDVLWVFGFDAMVRFTNEYLSFVPFDSSELAYWDLCASVRLIHDIPRMAPAYPALGRADITEESLATGHRLFVDQAMAKL